MQTISHLFPKPIHIPLCCFPIEKDLRGNYSYRLLAVQSNCSQPGRWNEGGFCLQSCHCLLRKRRKAMERQTKGMGIVEKLRQRARKEQSKSKILENCLVGKFPLPSGENNVS